MEGKEIDAEKGKKINLIKKVINLVEKVKKFVFFKRKINI
jgi:hypothetical protein